MNEGCTSVFVKGAGKIQKADEEEEPIQTKTLNCDTPVYIFNLGVNLNGHLQDDFVIFLVFVIEICRVFMNLSATNVSHESFDGPIVRSRHRY